MEYLDSPSVQPLFYMAPRYFFLLYLFALPPPPLNYSRSLNPVVLIRITFPFFKYSQLRREL